MAISGSKDVEVGNIEKVKSLSIGGAADPFEPREGKVLTWTDINMTLVRSTINLNKRLVSFFKNWCAL